MKIFCAFSTHWDREWYLPFQGFRYKLVGVTQNVLAALESGSLEKFHFDGQTVVLEDYLEIKQDDRERLTKLIKDGRLVVGPWYIMPDEILVSGESLVRNLLEGKAEAEKFGAAPWKYGYMNDIFGHVAQMPQILNGFDIKGAYLGRGLGDDDKSFKSFVWKSPDGSECIGYKQSYSELCRNYSKAENKQEYLQKHLKDNDEGKDVVVFLFTDDHGDVTETTFDYLENLKKLAGENTLVYGMENMTQYLLPVKDELPTVTGELIETSNGSSMRLITNSISSYYPVKYQNDTCEMLLENKTAPALAMSKLQGFNIEPSFFRLAYRYLLKNQPHDSICGCSTDVVHEDMKYRYSQVKSISDAIIRDYESKISQNKDGEYCISVINYFAKSFKGTFVTHIDLPKNWSKKLTDNAFYQTKCAFELVDKNGNKVPYQILSIDRGYIDATTQSAVAMERYTVAIFGELCAMGETIYKVVPQKQNVGVKEYSDGELRGENEYLSFEITPDGSVKLTDKQSGRVYNGLNTFVDDGEMGNGWFSERPMSDNTAVSSVGAHTIIEIVRKDELVKTFRVTKTMLVPKYCSYDSYERSEERTELKIVSDISLKKGSKALEFETTVYNDARDHRLRMDFPTGACINSYYASQAFDMVKRHTGIEEKYANYSEPEPYEKNMSGIVCVAENEGETGLSFVGKAGMHECAVSKNGVISITMLRAFGRIMFGNIPNEKAQLEGKHTFSYAISTETDFVKLYDMKNTLFEAYSNVRSSVDKEAFSALEVTGRACISTVKPSEDNKGVVVRLFNPCENSERCEIVLCTSVKRAMCVTLDEKEKGTLEIKDGRISLELCPHKIETIYLEV